MKKLIVLLATASFLSACGGVSSDEIIADEVSTAKYDNWSCKTLKKEVIALQDRVSNTGATVDKRKDTQGDKQTLAVLLFWPAYFFVDENSLEAKKYAKLKGEYNAVSSVYRRKDCATKLQ